MPKKTVEKLEVKEIKTYQTSDGKVYDTEEAALEHERLLKNPEEWYKVKILELESEIAGLHITIERLEGKILALESKKFFPSQPHPDISPWTPYQQPFNPTAPTPKLPSEPGNVVYQTDITELSKLSDEELIKRGYNVTYAGHKRSIIPHVDLSTVCGNATTPPDATPLEACSHDVPDASLYYGSQAEKDFREWYRKNKK